MLTGIIDVKYYYNTKETFGVCIDRSCSRK